MVFTPGKTVGKQEMKTPYKFVSETSQCIQRVPVVYCEGNDMGFIIVKLKFKELLKQYSNVVSFFNNEF